MVDVIFEAVDNVWVCIKPGEKGFYKPLRQDRYMADGKPKREAHSVEETWGNRVFVNGQTYWLTLPMLMFIGLCETYCVSRDAALMAIEAGGSRRDRHEFHRNNYRHFKEVNEHCFNLYGKPGDYEGAKVWRRKMNLVITRIINNRPPEWVDTDVVYLKT